MSNPKLHNTIALICGIWFLLTGWVWGYLANVFISFPVAIVGYVFWRKAHKVDPANKVHKFTLYIYIAGLVLTVVVLVGLILYN